MAKFKVGDRVRRFEASVWPTEFGVLGREYTVLEVNDHGAIRVIDLPGESNNFATAGSFELVTPAITIEPGKHYRLRNGKVTGRVTTGDIGFEALVDGQVKVFDKAGGAVFSGEDIVEAWVPKVGERVRLVKDGKSTTGAVGKAATLVTWDTGTFIDNNDYLLDIDPPVDYRTMSVKENFTRATIDCFEPLLVAAPAQPAVWVPAVGDKVVWLEPFKASMYTKGKEYLIHKKDSYGALCITDDNDNPNHTWSNDNILRSFSLAVPLKIEAGRYYKTRDGRKVGPMETYGGGDGARYWLAPPDSLDYGHAWWKDGTFHRDTEHEMDLIAEWIDEPVAIANDNGLLSGLIGKSFTAKVMKPKFKVGDFVRLAKWLPGYYEVTKIEGSHFWIKAAGLPDLKYSLDDDWIVRPIATTTQPTAIVALIEDGQPKPAERPFVHATEAAAGKEAARLAGIHKGKQFGVYVLASTNQEAEPTYKHEWQRLAAKGEKINAIKELRSVTGMQLKPAKDVVEHFIDYPYGQLAA